MCTQAKSKAHTSVRKINEAKRTNCSRANYRLRWPVLLISVQYKFNTDISNFGYVVLLYFDNYLSCTKMKLLLSLIDHLPQQN